MPMRLDTTGFSQLQGAVGEIRELIADPATRAAVRAASSVMSEEMRRQAPVLDEKTAQSTSLQPGELKAGIRINSVRKISAYVFRAVIGPRRGTRRAAHLVEFGHRLIRGGNSHVGPRGAEGPGKLIGDVPAHPFIRPSFEASASAAIEEFGAELRRQLGRYLK